MPKRSNGKIARFLLSCLVSGSLAAQTDNSLSYEAFVAGLSSHPIMVQAGIKSDMGASAMQQARGGFDPLLQSGFATKSLDGKNYYDLQQAHLSMPTRSPLRFSGGVERNIGDNLNPQALTPEGGQWYAGVSFPLLQGLMTDARRTAWQEAVAYNDFANAESDKYQLSLWFDASKTYADWWNAYEKTQISLELRDLAQQRLGAVKDRAVSGDLPLIDTVEAGMQFRMREQQLAESNVRETSARRMLGNFIWRTEPDDTRVPVEPPRDLKPSAWPFAPSLQFSQYPLDSLPAVIERSQPFLRQADAEIRGMEAELRWKREQRKPQLDLTYSALSYLDTQDGDVMPDGTDYVAGIQFRYPLLNRAARGAASLQELKLNDSMLERSLLKTRIANQARALAENIAQFRQQLDLNTTNVQSLKILLDGERENFLNGESSLFLINQREMAYMDARFRLADLQSGLFKMQCELQYTLGLVP